MSGISPIDPRRGLGPAAVDLADALSANRIDRRDFLRRGAMLGLSATALAAVLQACASDEGSEPGVDGGARTDDVGNPTPPSTPDRIVVGIRQGDANSGLDPVNMTEIGTYAVVAQSFEYLVGVAADGAVAPMALATSWSPNEDGSVWTFVLREGPTWSNGMPLTSSDVAATMDRVVTAGNPGFDGVVGEESVSTPDERTAVFTLVEPNGNFPTLLRPRQSASAHHADRLPKRHDTRRSGRRHRTLDSGFVRRPRLRRDLSSQSCVVGWARQELGHRVRGFRYRIRRSGCAQVGRDRGVAAGGGRLGTLAAR
jgi:hypothetical protein